MVVPYAAGNDGKGAAMRLPMQEAGDMSTIATDILRDCESEIADLRFTTMGTAGTQPGRHEVLLRLCEEAHGTRIGYHDWVFPDGSQLRM